MKGIPMKTWEVRAILDNRKTVARRVVKPQPVCHGPNVTFKPHDDDFFLSAEKNWLRCRVCGHDPEYSREGSNTSHHWIPPYRPGDILYVRETWNYGYCDTTDFEFRYNETFFEELKPGSMKDSFLFPRYFYRTEDLDGIVGMKWRSSIHMPREAARIFLRVKDVRVERLQDITDDGVEKEGVPIVGRGEKEVRCLQAFARFPKVWNNTLKPKDRALYGWEANPWVFVISFERISRDEALQ